MTALHKIYEPIHRKPYVGEIVDIERDGSFVLEFVDPVKDGSKYRFDITKPGMYLVHARKGSTTVLAVESRNCRYELSRTEAEDRLEKGLTYTRI